MTDGQPDAGKLGDLLKGLDGESLAGILRMLVASDGARVPGGEVLELDEIVLRRDGDGNLLPFRVPLGTGHDIVMRPLTYGQATGYPMLHGERTIDWKDEQKARLIAENLVEPDLHGYWSREVWSREGGTAPPEGKGLGEHPDWPVWLGDHVGYEDVDVIVQAVVQFSQLRDRPRQEAEEEEVEPGDEGEKGGSTD